MPRASSVAVIGSILALTLAFPSLPAFAANSLAANPASPAESGTELVAANPGGTSTLVAVINYENVAGRMLRDRLVAFGRDNPDIKVVIRPVPGGGPLAEFLAKAAYAAAQQGRFAAFHDAALTSPQAHTWYSLRDNAPLLGLDWPRFQQDFQNPKTAEAVQANVKFAEEMKITSPPAVVTAGRVFTGPWEKLNFTEVAAAARANGAVHAVGAK